MITVHNLEIGIAPSILANLNEISLTGIIKDIAEAARTEWLRLAGSMLHTTRQTYINGIQPTVMASGMATISLLGVLPDIVENGMSETDMRTTLLGPNALGKHRSEEGYYYRAIPFRHATPTGKGAEGANVGIAMGKSYAGIVANAKKLGRDVYREAKK